ncbi:hypothetical protein D3C72_1918050 [compost metagenome]
MRYFFFLLLVSDFSDPLPDAGNIRQSPFRTGFTLPDFYRYPVFLIHDAKTAFIGQVVTDKDRCSPFKRHLGHERLQRLAFIDSPWLDLNNAFAWLNRQLSVSLNDRRRKLSYRLLMLWRTAIVQCKGHAFRFQFRPRKMGKRRCEFRMQ